MCTAGIARTTGRWRQTRLREFTPRAKETTHSNIARAGDPFADRRNGDGVYRIGFQNIRGTDIASGLEATDEIDAMLDLGIDAMGMSETNRPWTPGNKWKYDFMMSNIFGQYSTIWILRSRKKRSNFSKRNVFELFSSNARSNARF